MVTSGIDFDALLIMRLLLFFCCIQFGVFGQDTTHIGSPNDSLQPKSPRFDSITQANKYIDFYTPEAEFVGGYHSLIAFINDSIEYPQEAIIQGLEGKVYVRFTVAIDGSVTDIEVVKSAHPLLDAAAVRLISIMPNWIPAVYKGECVPVKMSLPITFTISDEE